MSKSSPSKVLKFRNLLWKLHYKLEKIGQLTSFEKLTDDPRYRAIVLSSALKSADNTDLTTIAEKIIEQEKILDIHYILNEDDTHHDISNTIATQEKDNTWLKTTLLTLLFLFIAISVYSCNPSTSSVINKVTPEKKPLSTEIKVTQQTLVSDNNIVSNKSETSVIAENTPKLNEKTTRLLASVKADKVEKTGVLETQKEAPPSPPTHTIMRLHGSNTIGEKLAPALIKAYLASIGATNIKTVTTAELERSISAHLPKQGWINIELHAHGSTTAFKDLDQGLTDMGMASRKIKDKEVILLKDRYGDLTRPASEHIIGLDGIAIIVNKANPIDHLNTEQLAQLFSGKVTNWSEIGGDNIPVTVYSREANSGTWDTFKNLVLKKYQKKLSPVASRFESSSKLSDKVSEEIGAIGFIGLPYVRHSKLLAVADNNNTQSIIPTLFTVGTEDYPLARRLFFYTPALQTPFIRDFVEFSQSPVGQNIVKCVFLRNMNTQSYPS
ncbi:MAG: phosphate ABC transporter substrate-binding protein [Methylophaga sp.]|nr:phosphate ABC transporter substrate-binding protein [Methylophaga sp.]